MKTADAQYFWANHPGDAEWCAQYIASRDEATRGWVIDGLQSLPDVTTVLEVGCHCGPLLQRMQEQGYSVAGIDLNAVAIAEARKRGLTVAVGSAPDALTRFPDHSLDALVSSYCLAYISPDDLDRVLYECLRVVKRGVVLVEPMAYDEEVLVEQPPYVAWRHDYVAALFRAREMFADDLSLSATLYPRDVVNDCNAVVVARWT